ncbi:class I SAM-dependent methyltransferase [Lacinutrix sp. C3R15]|uniref:class I SAM-dependent methyltransferase n=1 Tax=Flavobacteriaceae TaxID=49546 RepID=UPI001C08497D|nr:MULTISPECIES: class I SAM-dependent methyltransferase [Flavobacteriaceae]MBU2938706.1 class I SAM-dependent methyltransferase [Lacinutrix sp. C3R15]MDO6622020.1 class I SAM-dependent methyltransferase [Oceanihabitans sp. 1_MG-2023]
MNINILHTKIQEFINSNLDANIASLLLKGIAFSTVEAKEVIEQLEAKKRCKTKLHTWFTTEAIYYPNKLNIEQTSSETTAKYKASLIQGNSIIDITGGFGVDDYYFSKHFKQVTHCEINKQLSQIVTHNYKQLKANNITTIAQDGLEYLKNSDSAFDWIYIDPSRRHDSKGKVFFLKDCLPNVPAHLELLFNKTNNILIKTSPLLDISIGLSELQYVKSIHIVAVNNEVKELLWTLKKGYSKPVTIETCNLKKNTTETFAFQLNEESSSISNYSTPLTYLYEPNAAIMKSGAFHTIANKLQVLKLHQHSHLYTKDTFIDFPGRVFKIEKIVPYNKKILKKEGYTKANIATRNFPESVEQIRKKHKIKDGGDIYLFFTTDLENNKIVVQTKKVA